MALDRFTITARQPPAGATSGNIRVAAYPDSIASGDVVGQVTPPNWQTQIFLDAWGLHYYRIEYNDSSNTIEGPFPLWSQSSFWNVTLAERVYDELKAHVEALSALALEDNVITDPVRIFFGATMAVQPPCVVVSSPSFALEPAGFPLLYWGYSTVGVTIVTKLGGISHSHRYHHRLAAGVMEILSRLIKQRFEKDGVYSDIIVPMPARSVQLTSNVVLMTTYLLQSMVLIDEYFKEVR